MRRKAPLRHRIDKAALEKLYHQQGLSTVEIAERLGSYSSNIIVLMDKYEIPRRSQGAGKRRKSP
jgi:DNA-binding transcriptional regulator LsrR (DeoR family)